MSVRNAGIYLQAHTALQARRTLSTTYLLRHFAHNGKNILSRKFAKRKPPITEQLTEDDDE
jgi:hypothetical protein